jgi:polyribonucleotide nucleotidyltransferase
VQFLRGPGRREIGHGALAERALAPMIPGEDKFPYTIRVVSDILESNGSSSMASVCGGSLAMFDAGVPLKAPVAGVAMGLIMDETSGKYAVLTDIAGAEDHYGDMDFKVAGSADGITALQMDIKVAGITMDIMRKALEQARAGRMFILQKMQDTLSVARENVSAHAPRIVTIRIPVDKIRDVIGPGGKMIRSIIERTGVKIDVEDDGRVNVASADEASAQKAISIIQELTATPELNKTYLGKVQRITDFGAFVEIMPGLDGLLHVSEIAHYRVKDVRDELKEGEQVMVKVINIDPSGKIRLSRKALIEAPEGGTPASEGGPREGGERPRREGGRYEGGRHEGSRGGYRGDRDRDRGDRGHRGGHDRRSEGGHERRPHADNSPVEAPEVSGAARTDEPSGGEKE